ncbi:MAG: hypothetical protein VX325_04460 [Bacteroidota bacterium]|nr:hypothetical protein [Bacteroidota bacterium]
MNLDKKIFESKAIFVFSDPAGANVVFSLIDNLISAQKVYKKDFLIFTDKHNSFEEKYNSFVQRINFSEKKAYNIFNSFKPNYIFCGTSINNFEHQWRKFYLNKIKVYSFIDHWTNYYKRFSFNNEVCFGDEIWVLDDLARKEAISEGIPEGIIKITGNPYYEKVKLFSPDISKREFFNKLNLNEKKKTILFISDDIKLNFGKDNYGNCILGYDEYSILEEILFCFETLKIKGKIKFSDYQLVIKIHPQAEVNKFNHILHDIISDKIETKVIKFCDSLMLNYFSDYVVGMFSNMVIESYLMQKKLLRVQIGQIGQDLIKMRILKNKVIVKRQDLYKKMKNFLSK